MRSSELVTGVGKFLTIYDQAAKIVILPNGLVTSVTRLIRQCSTVIKLCAPYTYPSISIRLRHLNLTKV